MKTQQDTFNYIMDKVESNSNEITKCLKNKETENAVTLIAINEELLGIASTLYNSIYKN